MSGPKMPPRELGYAEIPLNYDGLVVGKVPVKGAGLRVGLMCDGKLALMSPAKARRLAGDFESEGAKAAELDWVAVALRECADEIDALTATKQ